MIWSDSGLGSQVEIRTIWRGGALRISVQYVYIDVLVLKYLELDTVSGVYYMI